jgi:predicted MarR family transcription regulator
MTPNEQISSHILELQTAIEASLPKYALMLRDIHKALQANPDVVTLLKEEEIAIIVSGLEKHTKTELITATKNTAKKAIKSLTLQDL